MGKTPKLDQTGKPGEIKEGKSKAQGNMISIEKRMPINIFNIKNVNYLNTDPQDTSQAIFKNEVLKDKRYANQERAKTKPRDRKGIEQERERRRKSFNKTCDKLGIHETENEPLKARKRSLDSKCLIEMMTKVNQMKTNPTGAKILFQKIVRNFEKTDSTEDDSSISLMVKYLKNLKSKFEIAKGSRNKSIFDSPGKKTSKSGISDIASEDLVFRNKTKKLAKELSIIIQDFKFTAKSQPHTKQNAHHQATQTFGNTVKSIGLTNLNTQNLIKEFSRAFMFNSRICNSINETGSDYMRRMTNTTSFKDEQTTAVFKDIFSLEQEHVLVEESLKMIQERGYDLEALFGEAYHKLGITGTNQRMKTEQSDDLIVANDVSAVTFESKHLPECEYDQDSPACPRDTNCFYLDFDRLDRSE